MLKIQQWVPCTHKAENKTQEWMLRGNSRFYYLSLVSQAYFLLLPTATPPSLSFHTSIPTVSSRTAASPSPIHPPRCGHGHHSLMHIWSCLRLSQPSKAPTLSHRIEALLMGWRGGGWRWGRRGFQACTWFLLITLTCCYSTPRR